MEEDPTQLQVADTKDLSRGSAFELFREALSNVPIPWSLELSDLREERDFTARVEYMPVRGGFVSRVHASRHVADRTVRHVAKSTEEGYFVIFMLNGELVVEQNGAREVAKQGDLVIFDTARPSKMSYTDRIHDQHSIGLFASKQDFGGISLETLLLPRERLLRPLSACMSFMSENLLLSSQDEIAALRRSCLPLLTLATGRAGRQPDSKPPVSRSQYLFAELLDYVNRHIAKAELSAKYVATRFDISDRYLHKLFAASGSTFSVYVTNRRLQQLAHDLTSPSGRFEPIATVAYRWGFGDISTFNRVFKQKFGCSPRAFRAGSGH
jgi:AraC family transcriptional regulator, positive regulator of tynA and feaB